MSKDAPTEKDAVLANTPLFAQLRREELRRLASLSNLETQGETHLVFRRGDPGNEMYVIVSGGVKVSIALQSGKELVLGNLGPGESFGEIALFDPGKRTASVTTTASSSFLVIYRPTFLPFLHEHPDVAIRLLGMLAHRLRVMDEMVKDTLFLDTPSRLARKLLDLAKVYGRYTRHGIQLATPFSTEELAEITELSSESVRTQVRAWCRQRLLKIHRGYITMTDPGELSLLL